MVPQTERPVSILTDVTAILAAVTYDVALADRIREVVRDEGGVTEKRMFGGLAFLINGNMAVSASSKGGLLLRINPVDCEALISELHAHRFEMRGRDMKGWLRVDATGLGTDDELRRWVSYGVSYAGSLSPK